MHFQVDVSILSHDAHGFLLRWYACDNGMEAGSGQATTRNADTAIAWIGDPPPFEVEGLVREQIARALRQHFNSENAG